MPSIAKFVLEVIGKRAMSDFDQATKNTKKTQAHTLISIIRDNENTVYGNEHGFSDIRTVSDFRDRVPINTYDSLSPYIDQATLGGKNILTREDPFLFATTSGTTGVPKYIPITKRSRNEKSAIMRLWLYSAQKDHPDLFDGKFLTLVSPEVEGFTKAGIPCGAESGHVYRNIPSALANQYVAPYEVFIIKDYDAKYYTLLRIALEHNITFLGSCNPSTVVLLGKKMDLLKEDLIKDIREGTLKKELPLEDKIRAIIEPALKPNPDRALELSKIIETTGTLKPRDAWPNIKIIACWTGGNVRIFLKKVRDFYNPATPLRDWGYLASELRGSLPMADNTSAGVLTITTNFYEFIHLNDIQKPNPKIYLSHELEEGQQYYLYVTTSSGLYRYEMNDIIKVDGFYHEAPLISFVQKGKGVSSLTGEKLYETQVVESVKQAMDDMSVDFTFVSSVAQLSDPPYYSFLVEELPSGMTQSDKVSLINNIDQNLMKINIEYESKRKSLRLAPPVLKILKNGEFERYRKEKVAAGTPDGQFKMIQLTADFTFQDRFNIIESIPTNPIAQANRS